MADPQSYRPSHIPTDPGVYRFFDDSGKVIYVGKARNLKNRLLSYFGNNLSEKTYRMVHAASRVDWTIVSTDVEALQLEYTWIKKENPRFNVQFKDDKSYPYLAISLGDEYPRMYISRQKKIKGVEYIGPFAHAWALRATFDVLQRLYPIRTCSNGNFERARKSKRQCLLGDIGKCAAPCVDWVSQEEHHLLATKLTSVFKKSGIKLTELIQKEMTAAAESEQFERAAELRDQLSAIEKATESTDVALNPDLDGDFISVHEDSLHAAASIFIVRGGRITASRSWVVDLSSVTEEADLISSVMTGAYQDLIPSDDIYINKDIDGESAQTLESWLSEIAGSKVRIHHPQRGEKLDLLQTVKRNAHYALVQYLSKRSNDSAVTGKALEEIQDYLDLAEAPLRIECFDISNIQGNHMVASMVVFEDGQPKKSDYRRFSINSDVPLDDTRAMHQVITRRLKRYLAEKDLDLEELAMSGAQQPKFAYAPQLIVVDGGAPQVNAAAAALAELGLSHIPLCGLAKRLEEVYLPDVKDPIILPRQSEGLYLLQRVRDEAHRFAITFHRSKRSKVMLESLFDEIPHLGEMRRKALLEQFGSIAGLRKASEEQIASIPGIGKRIARVITEYLHDTEDNAASSPVVDTSTGEILE